MTSRLLRGLARLGAADVIEPPLQGQLVERAQREADENADALAEHAVGIGEGKGALGRVAGGARGIGHAPVRRHGLAGPDRADLVGRIVADREYEIELWRLGRGEL